MNSKANTGIDQEQIDIPAWKIKEIKKRLAAYKNNPGQALDFDAGMDDIEKGL